MNDEQIKISNEASRIEEDCIFSAKRHFNASSRWETYHFWVGLPSATLAGLSGISAFNDYPTLAGILAILSTALTSILTFLKPSERSEHHKSIGNQYLSLRNKTRLFRELEINKSIEEVVIKINELSNQRDELNNSAMNTSNDDYRKAQKDINENLHKYEVDKEK
jgi:competence protein ComGF